MLAISDRAERPVCVCYRHNRAWVNEALVERLRQMYWRFYRQSAAP